MIDYEPFSRINIDDVFFDSLKKDYLEFIDWFNRKAQEDAKAYILNEKGLQAFLYLKIEDGAINDIHPPLIAKRRMKIGTMKINPHGTRLGERFIKVALRDAIRNRVNEIYVTVFEHHGSLIDLFEEFGFMRIAKKETINGTELVLLKDLLYKHHDICKDFPIVDTSYRKYLLSIYPNFHTILFPDSILTTENAEDIIVDISHTNSIHKIYICKMNGVSNIKRGDNIIIYRTVSPGSDQRPWFKSVATTLCVAEEVKIKTDFNSINEYLDYCSSYSIFTDQQLRSFYNWSNLIIIKFLYNASFTKRVTMQKLVDEAGLMRKEYWGFRELDDQQYFKILDLGQINRKIIR